LFEFTGFFAEQHVGVYGGRDKHGNEAVESARLAAVIAVERNER
jgi:hypothetical protein